MLTRRRICYVVCAGCRCVPEVLCTFQDDTSLYILLNGRLAGGLHELGAKVRECSLGR